MESTELTNNSSSEAGQGLVEYALILVLVVLVLIVVVMMLTPGIKQGYCAIVASVKQVPVTTICP